MMATKTGLQFFVNSSRGGLQFFVNTCSLVEIVKETNLIAPVFNVIIKICIYTIILVQVIRDFMFHHSLDFLMWFEAAEINFN